MWCIEQMHHADFLFIFIFMLFNAQDWSTFNVTCVWGSERFGTIPDQSSATSSMAKGKWRTISHFSLSCMTHILGIDGSQIATNKMFNFCCKSLRVFIDFENSNAQVHGDVDEHNSEIVQ